MLSVLFSAQREQLAAVAQTWLDSGAKSVSVWANGKQLMCWPDGVSISGSADLVSPIKIGRRLLGQIRVDGLYGAKVQARLAVDAGLVSQLLKLEIELDSMTEELINNQDQLLALFDLTQSTRNKLNINEILRSLTSESARLIKAQGAFAHIISPNQPPTNVQYPSSLLDELSIAGLFKQLKSQGHDLLLRSNTSTRLPPGVTNLFFTPIHIQGKITAGLGLFNKINSEFYSPDIKLIKAIAEQAGAQIENVLLYQENLAQTRLKTEFDLAANIQLRLLPQSVPQIEGLELAATSRPALQVGGDFYDFSAQKSKSFAFTVGDVSGKGMPAALLMAMTRTVIRSRAGIVPTPTPEVVLNYVNQDMYNDFTEVGMFATVFTGQYNYSNQELMYANAGHSPVIFCPERNNPVLLEADGVPLGVLPKNLAKNQTLHFGPNDILLVATDGISEAENSTGEMFGLHRLLKLLCNTTQKTAPEILETICRAVEDFSAGHPQDDDQTLLVIKGVPQ